MVPPVVLDVRVDVIGRPAQGQLAQREQVARGGRTACVARRGLLGHVDLALLQALEQLFGREIDELDLVRLVEHAVGHRLAHGHAR